MNILLDECVPKRLGKYLTSHKVRTVPEEGWSGLKNGRLLAVAEAEFDVLISVDKSLRYQQVIADYNLAMIVLRADSNAIVSLIPLVDDTLVALRTIQPGEYVEISE